MDSAKPNDQMKKEALLGLSWRKEFGRGGTMVGVARARDIANGANLSLDTIKRMNSFFARHEVDKEAQGFRPGEKGYPSNGRIAWALWGGDSGKAWASSKLEMTQGVNMIFPEDEEFLSHFGTKGMKWGVRKGKKTTGVTRTRGQKIEKNTNQIKRIEKAKAGEKYKVGSAIGKKILGKPEWERKMNQKISDLDTQNQRLSSGKKLTLNDRFNLIMTTAIGRNFLTTEIR